MHVFTHNGCDAVHTPVLHIRHNVKPIEFGRCVSVVALMNTEEPMTPDGKFPKPIGVKLVQCWKDGSGHAEIVWTSKSPRGTVSVGRKAALDAAFLEALAAIEKIDKRFTPEKATEREKIGTAFLEVLTSEGNDWPEDFAKLIDRCAA